MNQIRKEFNDIQSRHPAKIPIILQLSKELEGKYNSKKKILIPFDYTVSELMTFIRIKMSIRSGDAIFLFFDDKLLSGSQRLYDVWDKRTFMFVRVCQENTFGL
jgi:hypothetical protein